MHRFEGGNDSQEVSGQREFWQQEEGLRYGAGDLSMDNKEASVAPSFGSSWASVKRLFSHKQEAITKALFFYLHRVPVTS